MNIEFILNDALSKALCQKGRIQNPNSNTIAEFVTKYLQTEKINYTRCCDELKEDKEYTFTIDTSNQKKTEEFSNELKKILALPSEIYFIDKEGNRIRF